MKKMNVIKALFAAAALAFVLPGCGDISEETTAQTQVTKDGKVAVSLSVREEFRTIISAVDTNDLAYTLVITDTADSTAADYEAPKTIELTDLTGTVAYLTPEKTYSFALTGYAKDSEGNATETAIIATRSAVQKKITASDATVSLTLKAVEGSTVQVSLTVNYTTGYGVSDVSAVVYDDSALETASDTAKNALALSNTNARNNDKTDGNVEFTGTIATGSTKWVKITLNDGTKDIGSKTVALYGIPTGDLAGEETVAVKEYKATVNLTADTKPESLTLKNQAVTADGYTGISLTTESTANPYEFSAYVPVGTYDVYNGETLLGQVATSTTPLTVDTSVTLTGVAAAWTSTQPTLYVGAESNEDKIKSALTVTATLSTGDEAVTNYTLNFDNTTAGEQTATISYAYNGKTETATVTLTLTAVELESIAVDAEASAKATDDDGNARTPLNLNYTTNDSEIDLTGLVLKLTNNDGSTSSVAYSGDNITKTGYFEDSNDAPGTVISDEATFFVEPGIKWVQVTYSGKTVTFKVTVEKGVTYVVEGKYNLTTSAKAGYTVDGNENGKWDAQSYNKDNNPTQTHDGITITGAVTNNGFDSHGKNSPGTITFVLNSTMYLTFADSNSKGVTIKSTDGGSVDGTVGGKDAVVGASSKPSTFLLTAGSYTMASTTAGSTRIATLEFNSLATTWANAKASAGTAAEYWTGWDAISTALSATPSTDDEYLAAISALQSAINAAVKYVAPTAITVTYADTPVENGAELSFSKASGNTLTLTAKENEGSTGSLTWTVEGIEGISKEVSVADDGISTCVISGITEIGTINVKVEDTRASLSKAFTITVTANVVKVEADDSVTVTASESSVEVGRSILLTAETEKSYSESVTYNWYKNNTAIAGATTPTYSYTPTVDDVGSVTFKVTVTGSEATATSNTYSVMVTLTDYTELFSKYGTSAGDITKTDAITCAETTYYFASGMTFAATTGDKFASDAQEFTLADDSKASATNRIELVKAASTATSPAVNIPVAADCKISVLWYCNGTSDRGPYLKTTKGTFTAVSGSITNKTSSDGKSAWSLAKTKIYSCSVFEYKGEADTLTLTNTKSDGTAAGGTMYLYGVIVSYNANVVVLPDPNTTVSVDSGISSDITLTADANVFTVAGAPVTASGSTIAWLVDGVAVENESATTFTLTGKTTGEWYDVTAKVTDAGGVVYTKTTSVRYTGN